MTTESKCVECGCKVLSYDKPKKRCPTHQVSYKDSLDKARRKIRRQKHKEAMGK